MNFTIADQEECRTRSKIGINRIRENHWHAHRGRCDDKGNFEAACIHNLSCPDDQFAVMASSDQFLKPVFDVPSEMMGVKMIDTAIHKPETIGRTNHRINRQIEN